jgi:hypothetical protein
LVQRVALYIHMTDGKECSTAQVLGKCWHVSSSSWPVGSPQHTQIAQR